MTEPGFRPGPLVAVRRITRQTWRDVLSVYYANTPVWRWLKSGALVMFGLADWSGTNLLHSYVTEWDFLTYPMAYGFLLVLWGPLTHFFVVPGIIRLRRSADGPLGRWLARNGSKFNIAVFLGLVLVLGTFTPGVMTLEFSGSLVDSGSSDVTAELVCDVDDGVADCHLEDASGFDHAVVLSGGTQIERVDDPPYAFEVRREELAETRTGAEFAVELRDEEGNTLRRFVRTL